MHAPVAVDYYKGDILIEDYTFVPNEEEKDEFEYQYIMQNQGKNGK